MKKGKKIILYSLLAFFLYIIIYVGSAFVWPNIDKLKTENPTTTAFMEYRKEQWNEKNEIKEIKHTWIPIKNVSSNLVVSVLIAEDRYFYKHNGFDIESIKWAIKEDIKTRSFRYGGSTISQQLAKNLYLSPSKNPLRKMREAVITWRLERTLSKERILELYLNVVEWGDGIYGIEEAAKTYYGKSSSNLNFDESIRLSVALPNPRLYNPTKQSKYVNDRVKFITAVINRMNQAKK